MIWKAAHDWPPSAGEYLVTLVADDLEPFVDIAMFFDDGRWRLRCTEDGVRGHYVQPYAWTELPAPSLGATTQDLSTDLSTGKGAKKGTIDPE